MHSERQANGTLGKEQISSLRSYAPTSTVKTGRLHVGFHDTLILRATAVSVMAHSSSCDVMFRSSRAVSQASCPCVDALRNLHQGQKLMSLLEVCGLDKAGWLNLLQPHPMEAIAMAHGLLSRLKRAPHGAASLLCLPSWHMQTRKYRPR